MITRTITGLVAVTALLLITPLAATAADTAAPAAGASAIPAAPANPDQLRCLSETPKQPRFKLPTDRVWPAKPGEADICLWADDKLAAASITIDDNWASDHPWWLDLQQKTGFKFTWFVIVERVGTGGLWGTWNSFKKLREQGHDVQSHTVSHNHGQLTAEEECRDSQAAIEKNMPGNKVKCLAYPGGKGAALNDQALAARYYIAGRGTVGSPNRADLINYNCTSSARIQPQWIDIILTGKAPADFKRRADIYHRGWLCSHYHGVQMGSTDAEKKADADGTLANMMYLKSKEADIWVGLFREVVTYGQERDTAKLTVTASTAEAVKFTLADRMDDTLFDYPLTVKVRLPEAWKTVSATQGGQAVEAKLIDHAGGKFALVKAVPDRGEVALAAAPAK